MNLRDWNVKLKLLRLTKRRLKLSIKSRAINSNGRFCFTIRLSGTVSDTTYLTISISVERSEDQMNLRCYSITCKSTIWRRARSRSSSKLYVAFQTLARERRALYRSRVSRTLARVQQLLARGLFRRRTRRSANGHLSRRQSRLSRIQIPSRNFWVGALCANCERRPRLE